MQTFPLIGNYGIIESDFESDDCYAAAYVVREYCDKPSNFRCEKTLDEFLKQRGIVGIAGVDTREITKIIRETGVMNAKIVDNFTANTVYEAREYTCKKPVDTASRKKTLYFPAEGEEKYKVALIDYGAKMSIVRNLTKNNCSVTLVPCDIKAEDILKMDIDGIMLSNGPGDPAENTEYIEELKKLIGKKPIFGICLGHQLLALAFGGKTVKLKYGHRGANQPVKDLKTGRVYMSSQNHGYAVESESLLGKGGVLRFINVNDRTCEGIDYPEYNIFSVQFHPEACSGPRDTESLFDRFAKIMGGKK